MLHSKRLCRPAFREVKKKSHSIRPKCLRCAIRCLLIESCHFLLCHRRIKIKVAAQCGLPMFCVIFVFNAHRAIIFQQ